MIRIRNLTVALMALTMCAVLTVTVASPANASSALDQYVEDVPDPLGPGERPDDPEGKRKDNVKPERVKQLKHKGEEGETLAVIASTTGPSSGPPGSGLDADGSGSGSEAGTPGSGLVGSNEPGDATESISAVADTSGFNAVLAVAVLLLAGGMAVLAWHRRGQST